MRFCVFLREPQRLVSSLLLLWEAFYRDHKSFIRSLLCRRASLDGRFCGCTGPSRLPSRTARSSEPRCLLLRRSRSCLLQPQSTADLLGTAWNRSRGKTETRHECTNKSATVCQKRQRARRLVTAAPADVAQHLLKWKRVDYNDTHLFHRDWQHDTTEGRDSREANEFKMKQTSQLLSLSRKR